MKIGFFDSGLGGLTILKEVVKVLPQYDYFYYGDTANLPFGDKTEEEVYELTKQALIELFNRECALVIVACNTSSAETLRRLQDTFVKKEYPDRKVLGVIVPTIEDLLTHDFTRAILLATKRTADSEKYQTELHKLATDKELITVAASALVPLIEGHDIESAIDIAIQILEDHEVGEGEIVVLGCTHYTLLTEKLREKFPGVVFISQDEIIPKKLSEYLDNHKEIVEKLSTEGRRDIHLTEHKDSYDELASYFLNGAFVPRES